MVKSVQMSQLLPAERPVLILLLLGFFVRRLVGATLCTDYRQIWHRGGGPNILLIAKVENLRGVIWGILAQNTPKLRNNLENARKIMSTNPLVENYDTYNINATLWSTSVF